RKMKIVSKEEQDAQQRATVMGGLKGLAGGLAFAAPASYLLYRRFPYYRTLQPSLKAFGVIIIAVPSIVISAERAGIRFEKQHWTGVGKQELDTVHAREQARWDAMTFRQKARDVAVRHEYGLIGSCWALSMVGAFGLIMRSPYQTFPQKIVQARMWAQGLTIGIIIAAGALTHSRRAKEIDENGIRYIAPDHSWKEILEQEEQNEANGVGSASAGKAV
ncbi:hypothetical protein B0H21DRAFT_717202, partial [Amylocystis lapponica]